MYREFSVPTAAELYALERRAREERARFVAAGLRSAYRAIKTALQRAATALRAKEVRHA